MNVQSNSSSTPPPGWYTNANGQAQWWDGTRWGVLASAPEVASSTHASEPRVSTGSQATADSTSVFTQLAPADWYPAGENILRYWDGTSWTEHTAPIASNDHMMGTSQPQRPFRLRWKNLLSLRWWWFTFGGSVFLTVLIGLLSPAIAAALFPFLFILVGFVWLTIPMTCEHCGKMLKSSKAGNVSICHHCHLPVK
ncbi:DUF2510 domain-containing protein [Leucobacter alluvii]